MEELFLNIIKDATGQKLAHIKQSGQEAHDLLNSQCGLLRRSPSYELRAACFKPLQQCLESKRSKLVSYSLTGLQKMVRDERFHTGAEPEDDSLWLPAQLLHATASMLTQCEDTQVQILRVVLSLACNTSWALNGRLVMLLLGRCGEAYDLGTQPVKAAAQAAASQTLTAFCTFLDEECIEILQQQQKHKNSNSMASMVYTQTSAVACFNEAIPVMQYICSTLEETKAIPKSNDNMIFLLECLLTLVSTLPQTVHSNIHFTTFLWQRFCPALLALLGAPGDPSGQTLTTQQSKIVYSIGIQVVRLVGSERPLRPVLEALFHRMLLLPNPTKRLEPLRAAKELLRSPGRLADLLLLSGPCNKLAGDDMAIIRLIMDSIEESAQCLDPAVILASVECVSALMGSLEALCKGEGLSMEAADTANLQYLTLEQADYKGPLTYQSLARLPKPYRDVVANLKYQSDSDSSGVDGGNLHLDDASDSDCSGATEGPEDAASASEDSIMDDESFLTSHQLQKLHNLPKSLHLGRAGIEECNVDVERHNAKRFVKTLQNVLLPSLLTLRSSIQIDQVLQEFASKCCQHNSAQNYEITTSIMNADGIYLATYSALLLNLRLIQLGHYVMGSSVLVPLTEEQFVEEIHGSGVLVYVSASWLSELYQQVLAHSLLEVAGYDCSSAQQPAIVNLLTDVGGLCTNQFLSDWQRLEKVRGTPESSPESDAGIKLSRRVLTCCWSSVVSVLGVSLQEAPPAGSRASALGRLVARRARQKYRQRMREDVIAASLEGLHKAASLSNTLKLQTRSSAILELLSVSSCVKQQETKLNASHALSLEVLLSKGLELGSHSSACWQHVFNACVTVASIEHALFSNTGSGTQPLLMVSQNTAQNSVVTSTTAASNVDRLNLSFSSSTIDEETCIDVYSFLQGPSSTGPGGQSEATVTELVERSGAHRNGAGQGTLRGVHLAKVCCVLSTMADDLFHSAALRLALPGLCSFLTELCKASHKQLFARDEELAEKKATKKWWKRELDAKQKPSAILLLHRIGEVTLKCIRAGRPLIHTMKVWSIVGPHFMQAACHKDRTVNKKAIACIHDTVTALLNEQTELPYFHFNEALFKPFENLLCLELCDTDVQDQIVACLCEFVEANRTEICSGWRPLFGTLRVANTTQHSAGAVLEVFKIFLSTDNTLVFANAALDYVQCLLTHIRGSNNLGIEDRSSQEKEQTPLQSPDGKFTFLDNLDGKDGRLNVNSAPINMNLESLKLLQSCVIILGAMYEMPKCPTFNMSNRKKGHPTEPQLIDTVLQNMEIVYFQYEVHQHIPSEISYKILSIKEPENGDKAWTLERMDRPSSILKVWYNLVEGLTSATVTCDPKVQPYVLETLFKMLKDLIDCPGANFGLYCINHLLLPMVQTWLRQNVKMQKTWDNVGSNFKHCCGMTSDLIVEYLFHLHSERSQYHNQNMGSKHLMEDSNGMETLALKQLCLILIECVTQANESIARLGTSCIRHLIISAGQILTAYQWEIIVTTMHRACTLSLNPLHQLTLAFKQNSDSFYGDLAVVKVAARKDCTVDENLRLNDLARQVYQTSAQRRCINCSGTQCHCPERTVPPGGTDANLVDDRSYVFLLYPPTQNLTPPYTSSSSSTSSATADMYAVRVSFRSLVVGILAHQMLIQTISSTLLQNLNHVTPILNILQVNNCTLRGILTHMNAKHIEILLNCLEMSNFRSENFDSRPGLKFLTQKVGNLEQAANLYTQSNASEVVQIIVLVELCLDSIEKYQLTSRQMKRIFQGEGPKKGEGDGGRRDLDYVEQFLWKLKRKWDHLCESYLSLTINLSEQGEDASDNSMGEVEIVEEDEEEVVQCQNASASPAQKRPFKLSDLARSSSFCSSTDSEGYLEKDVLPDLPYDNENSRLETSNKQSKEELGEAKEATAVEQKPARKDSPPLENAAGEKQKQKEDHTLKSETEHDSSEVELQAKAMMEQYRKRKPNHLPTPRVNPFIVNATLPQPQPVPPEIQQQRAVSIRKDADCYKITKIETMEASIELLQSLPTASLTPLASILYGGTQKLLSSPDEKIKVSAHILLERMEDS